MIVRVVLGLIMVVWYIPAVRALEPDSAFEDGFAFPGVAGCVAAVYAFPGAEVFAEAAGAALAWKRPFGVDDLAVTSAIVSYGHDRFGISASFSTVGFDLYGEEQVRAGVAYSPTAWCSAGVRLTRSAVRFSGYGDLSAWGVDAGAILTLHPKLTIALAQEALGNTQFGESSEPLDGRTRLSAALRTGDMWTLLAGATSARRHGVSPSAGAVVEAFSVLSLGVLGGTNPDRVEFLAGAPAGQVRFCYRGAWHPALGMTHGFSLAWEDKNARR